MKFLLSSFLALASVCVAQGQVCPERSLDGNLDTLSLAVRVYTQCVIDGCQMEGTCTGLAAPGSTCSDVEQVCDGITNQCCPSCACDLAFLFDSAIGIGYQTCQPYDCSGGNSAVVRANDGVQTQTTQGACFAEAVAQYTDCVMTQCPSASPNCAVMDGIVDNCSATEIQCRKVSDECCPNCAAELAAMLDCSTGAECPAFNCGGAQQVAPGDDNDNDNDTDGAVGTAPRPVPSPTAGRPVPSPTMGQPGTDDNDADTDGDSVNVGVEGEIGGDVGVGVDTEGDGEEDDNDGDNVNVGIGGDIEGGVGVEIVTAEAEAEVEGGVSGGVSGEAEENEDEDGGSAGVSGSVGGSIGADVSSAATFKTGLSVAIVALIVALM